MRFARSVASLASGIGRRLVSFCNALVMRVLIKLQPDVGVAGLANGAPDISVLDRIR